MTQLPLISIVTTSFNHASYLEETILSVINQGYPNVEHIIIDGGSQDGTVEVIKRYESHLAYWVSEPDRGQVHALNKGLERSTGDIFGFLNSDDVYLPGVLSAVGTHFARNPKSTWICGDSVMFGEGHATEMIRAVVPRSAAHCLSWAYRAAQPGMFWRREVVNEGFDEAWPYDFDHDLYVKLLLAGHRCEHIPLPFAGYRLHAASKTVAEGNRQEAEFERSAELYESRLHGSGKRWCRATRFLRNSKKAGESGDRGQALGWVLKSMLVYPEGLRLRRFWGSLRSALTGPGPRAVL